MLFLASRFEAEATAEAPSLDLVKRLSGAYGNTMTSTLWRLAEQAHGDRPMIALVTGHPHPARRKADFDPANPCRYCIQSPLFCSRFGQISEAQLFALVAAYAGSQSGGMLGHEEVELADRNGQVHVFWFETFFNRYEALTLGIWVRQKSTIVGQFG